MAMNANATVERLTTERRIDSPLGVMGQRGRASEWGTLAAGRRYHWGRRFVNVHFTRCVGSDTQRLLGAKITGSFVVVRGNSSVGRAQPCQGWGRGFESRFPLCVIRGWVSSGPLARRSPLGWRNR